MSNPSDKGAARRRRGGRGTILYLCLLVAGVFAAWQMHLLLNPQKAPHKAEVAQGTGAVSQPGWMDDRPIRDLGEVAANPSRESGWAPVNDDPLGVRPPPGAQRLGAYRHEKGYWQGRYSFRGELSDALEHYREAFQARRFELLKDWSDQSGWHWLVFVGNNGETHANVGLRNAPGNAKMVMIHLSVVPPAK